MLFTKTTFIGIDPTAGRHPFVYAALDHELQVLALGEGEIDDVLAFVGGQQDAFVAVNAPRRPNQGLMNQETVRARYNPPPRPGRWARFRVAEYELGLRKIPIPRTPQKVSRAPRWMQMGFQVFRRLEALGYTPYPAEDRPRQSLEVYPHGAYTVLLERPPFPKKTLEGRLQRQLVLYTRNVEVTNPMRLFEEITRHRLLQGVLPLEGLHTQEELDALIAAYTAWMAATRTGEVSLLGDAAEGQIVLPAAQLRLWY